MPCYKPLQGFRSAGGKGISFNPRFGYVDQPMAVPCGQCIGCRLERSRQWAVRCMHEASLHPLNCFLTLTYNEDKLPEGGTLIKKDLQDFMKRLRRHIEPMKISFFQSGEYGDDFTRPHYHALIFGYDFPDKRPHKENKGNAIFVSDTLDSLWGHGFCYIGSVSFESAAYVARYVVKKVNGDMAENHYQGRLPEFATMSTRPAIGKRWIEKWSSDTYPADTVVSRGFEAKPPRYYDKILERSNPALFETIKRERKLRALEPENQIHNTPERLAVRAEVTQAKFKLKS